MPLIRSSATARHRLGRPARPSCRGGVSSLLRLAQPLASKLPSMPELSGWLSRAGGALGADAGR